ncbi:50S ribosomal protein L3 [Alphaproteobacteria bacterium endosymbiont of Tiliacea citrago]|uniref:50S ribosomal protein L3 n=1 Tax=Alphaproteobacteria bacterium endosymbiont of Tiliacea citrago TaxID=3077944 RepID=UPI00313E44D1
MSFQSRFGWIGQKIGMTNVMHDGKVCSVTLVKILTQHVLSKIEHNGVFTLRVGVELGKLKTKPQIIELQKINKPLCNLVKEFRVSKEEYDSIDGSYSLDRIADEKFLDVTARSIGKGFAGAMKRWNFKGAGASHGVSLTHRAIGSIGTREKSWPNKKMAGRLGNEQVTVQSIPVIEIDQELSIVALHGSVPGKSGAVILRKAIKKQGVIV